jgi:hypothetical protein
MIRLTSLSATVIWQAPRKGALTDRGHGLLGVGLKAVHLTGVSAKVLNCRENKGKGFFLSGGS